MKTVNWHQMSAHIHALVDLLPDQTEVNEDVFIYVYSGKV